MAILFNSRGIDRSVEGGRERYRLLFIFARFKQAGFDLEIGRVKIDTSREGGEGIGWIDREKGRNGVSGINSGINNPYGCATITMGTRRGVKHWQQSDVIHLRSDF